MSILEYGGEFLFFAQFWFMGTLLRLWPVRDRLRIRGFIVALIYLAVFIATCACFVVFRPVLPEGYIGPQVYLLIWWCVTLPLPFLLTKNAFWQNVFVLSATFCIGIVVHGLSNWVVFNFTHGFVAAHPYAVKNLVFTVLLIVFLPVSIYLLDRTVRGWSNDSNIFWRVIWLIPALSGLTLIFNSVLFGAEHIQTPNFLIIRISLLFGTFVVCYVLANALRQSEQSARLAEDVRMMETFLGAQHRQYRQIEETVARTRALRHDMRHQLVAIANYLHEGDSDSALAHIGDLADEVTAVGQTYCENTAVNAVVSWYAIKAEQIGVRLDLRFPLPKDMGRVSEMDLCVITGNLLENAVEACARMESGENGERFITARVKTQGAFLVITVENSFDGTWTRHGDVYFSHKPESAGKNEGVGLTSVKMVCEKYGGNLKVTAGETSWQVSALVNTQDVDSL
jgi:hypothetical protein